MQDDIEKDADISKTNVVKSGTRKKTASPKRAAPAKKTAKAQDAVPSVLVLDSVLIINQAKELHNSFLSYLDREDKELAIDASSVELIDTAIAQLIYSFVTTLANAKTAVTWIDPSDSFVSRIRSLGLIDALGIKS